MSDGEHLLMQGYDNRGADLNIYTGRLAHSGVPGAKVESGCFIPDVDLPVWRIPTGWGDSMGSTLVRRGEPLGVQINLIETDPQLARRMRDRMIALMEEEGCPPEQYARLGLKRD